MIINSVDGGKHHTLLKASKLAGGYVGNGARSKEEAEEFLFRTIEKWKIENRRNALNTIRDGLKYGYNSPL